MKHKIGMGLLLFGTSIVFIVLMIYYALNAKLGIGLMIIVQFSNVIGIELITRDLEKENLKLRNGLKDKSKQERRG